MPTGQSFTAGTGAGAAIAIAGGTVILNGANTYSGGTTISGGTAVAGNNSAFGAGTVTIDGGTLQAGANNLTINNAIRLSANGGTVDTNSNMLTLSGVISDAGGSRGAFAKVGTGTLVLSGANTYSGGTTINAGTLQIAGSGTLGSTSAATTVAGGTLDLGGTTQTQNGGVTLTGGSITNGTLSSSGVFGVQAGTIDAVLAGSGALTKSGTGTVTLSSANTYTGGTTFAGGTVSVSSEANLGDVAGGLTFNGGTLQVTGTTFNTTTRSITWGGSGGTFDIADVTNNFFVSQNLNGGVLTKSGAGTLTLTGANSFSGATISAGKLVFSANSTVGNTAITNNAQLVFDTNATAGSAAITNNNQLTFYGNATAGNAVITNSGNVLFDGNSTPGNAQLINTAPGAVINFFTPGPSSDGKLAAGSIAGNGRFDLNDIELTVGGNNLSTNVTGVITGTGIATGTSLIKIGTGTLTLAGINTYTGATTVDGGVLRVDGSIQSSSGVTVNANGVLFGTGAVSGTAVNSGGSLLGGNGTAGTSLAISGNLAFQSGAYYLVQLNPATASSVNVSGAATLGGATVNAVFAPGSYVAKQYTILTAGSLSGTFGALVNTNLPSNFHTTLSYDASHAYLNLALNFAAPPGSGLSGNQQNVGNAIINSFNSNGGISLVYSGLTQASGEAAAGSQQTTFQAMGQFTGLLTDPFGASRETGAPAPLAYADDTPAGAARDAYAMLTKAPPATIFERRWSVWAAGFGGSQTTDGSTAQGSNSATSRLFGTAVGAEYMVSPQTLAGFALAGGGTSFAVAGSGSGRSDLFQAGAYVRHTNGPSYISAALAYGWQDFTTDRTVTLAGVDHLRAEFNANAWSGRVEGGYRFVAPWAGGVGLTPYAAGQFTTFNLPAYAETVVSGSNAFALAYAAKSVTDTRSELGLRVDKSFAMANGVLTLRGRVAWAHDFNPDHTVAATFQALPGASFIVGGARSATDSALTTASAEMKWLNGWSMAASFEGEFSDVTRSYAGKGAVRYAW